MPRDVIKWTFFGGKKTEFTSIKNPDFIWVKLELYNKLIESHSEIERKGKNNPYTSLNGHMFSFLGKDGVIAVRFSEEDKHEYNKKYGTNPVMQHGATMKGYVELTQKILKNDKEAQKYLQQSFDYIKTLKPKPTTKKK